MTQRLAILTFAALMFNISGAAMWLHQVAEHGHGHAGQSVDISTGAAWAAPACAGHDHPCTPPALPNNAPATPLDEGSDCDTCAQLLHHVAGITPNGPVLLGLLPMSVENQIDPTQIDQQPLFTHVYLRAPPRGHTLQL